MKKNVMTHFLLLVLVIMGSIALMANKQQEPNKDKDTFLPFKNAFTITGKIKHLKRVWVISSLNDGSIL